MGRKISAKLMTPLLAAIAISSALLFAFSGQAAQDSRELVKLPPMMRDHMLANMRDHLRALDEMIEALSRGEVEKAGDIAEKRLGMTSMGRHGAAHLARFMPKSMQAIGTGMHRAASKFVIAAANAELEPDREAFRKVYAALHQITQNCNACHAAFRLR